MQRDYIEEMKKWQHSPSRKPLLVRGARQIGKTYCIQAFAKESFEHLIEINFELQKEYKACFDTLYPEKILEKIYTLSHLKAHPGKTLLFLDEIQECPNAILALRYFYEKMPELHVITAGSLLEFTLRKSEFRMPVGRVESLYMYPLSFKEFLIASKEQPLLDVINHADLHTGIDTVYHERLLECLRQYWLLGGMPEVVASYLQQADVELCQRIQNSILEGYRADFGKYSSQSNIRYIQRLYDKSPGLVGRHFKYVDIDPDWQSREIKVAIEDLVDAGIIHKIKSSQGSGLPFAATANEKKFKLLFVDLGLVGNATSLAADILMQKDLVLLNRGSMAEQFVGQELLAYSEHYRKTNLFYWDRGKGTSTAEIDYLSNTGSLIFPIEVKAGATGSLRSLQLFLNEKKLNLGVRISQKPLGIDNRVLSIPLYMICELPRLVQQAT